MYFWRPYTFLYSDKPNQPPEQETPVKAEEKIEVDMEQQQQEHAKKEDGVSEVSIDVLLKCLQCIS